MLAILKDPNATPQGLEPLENKPVGRPHNTESGEDDVSRICHVTIVLLPFTGLPLYNAGPECLGKRTFLLLPFA